MADVAILNINNTDYNIRDEVARNAIPSPADAAPLMDGTAAVGTSTDYAREDHVHPTDTSRQATLVSGTNIKTVNNTTLLGSGNVSVQSTLVSGTNIKTVNGNSLLGSGDLTISDSDQNVTQTNTTGSAAYRVLFSSSANNTTETAGARKSGNLTFNPSTGVLTVSGSVSANGTTLTGNTGTVTSVGITNGGGISVSGSPITGSGNITLSVDNTADTGYLKKKSDTGYNETFRWNFQTNNDPDDFPYMRLRGFSTSTSEGTQYGVSFGPVYGSGNSSYYWMTNPELDRFQFSNSGFRIGADQGSDVTTKWSGLNGTWFVGNQSSQYNGTYGFLGKESVDNTNCCGFKLEPYSGEIKFRSYADRTGSDTVINKTKVDKWDDHTVNGNYNLTAATTQAVYPIKIDSRGHISAHGSAVTVPTASTTTPSMDGTASYGSGTAYARSNHVHPTDTSRAAKGNFTSFTVSSTTTTKSLTSGHIYLLVTKRMNNSATGGLYIVAPHTTTGSVTQIATGASTTVSISTTTLTITTTVNNIYCRLIDLDMPN